MYRDVFFALLCPSLGSKTHYPLSIQYRTSFVHAKIALTVGTRHEK